METGGAGVIVASYPNYKSLVRRRNWQNNNSEVAMSKPAGTMGNPGKAQRIGLFYRPQDWPEYVIYWLNKRAYGNLTPHESNKKSISFSGEIAPAPERQHGRPVV